MDTQEGDGREEESSTSVMSLVERSLGLITPNTEILIIIFCGMVGTMAEVAEFVPTLRVQDLFPNQTEDEEGPILQPELKKVMYAMSDGVDLARLYSVHIYIATYILLPYPLLTEKLKILLVPWLMCSVLRSILLRLLQSLAGIVVCAAQDKVYYKCLEYSIMNGLKLCFSLFIWTSIHSFYHYLDKKKSTHNFEMVIKTIHKAGIRRIRSDSIDSSQSSRILDVEGMDEDEVPVTEATLVERAAMAWIAREILEDDDEYVTDSQFSRYLAVKATMELRQITRELAEKRRESKRQSCMRERIKESLEFCENTCKNNYESTSETWPPKVEAFDESTKLSRRDPLRMVPPLVVGGRPFVEDVASPSGEDMKYLQVNVGSSTSVPRENSVEVQTDPLSSQMNQLFDLLDQQYAKQKVNNQNGQFDPKDKNVT